ncbi:MAG: type II toxin-antitoxin system VapB family antitoxin [Saprospiraceae bacterium]|nr:type II toxin-antitoxin system VapB family antitoxin [Saprospiraceae bacterium]HNL39590.1 type II toxin-antitoxin system VapB family antitoxin [Saprospiraceae bacterium]
MIKKLVMDNVVKVKIDDALLENAMRLSHLSNKNELINEALRQLVAKLQRQQMLHLQGKINWEGSLDEMRAI